MPLQVEFIVEGLQFIAGFFRRFDCPMFAMHSRSAYHLIPCGIPMFGPLVPADGVYLVYLFKDFPDCYLCHGLLSVGC